MTAMPILARPLLEDPLIFADQQIAEAEQRRERQALLVSKLAEGTQARTDAEHVLGEIEWTLSLSRMHRSLIQDLESLLDCP
jgi:hypothetical protein